MAIRPIPAPMTWSCPRLQPYGEPLSWSLCVPNWAQILSYTRPTQLLLYLPICWGTPSQPAPLLPLPPTPPGSPFLLVQVDVLTTHYFYHPRSKTISENTVSEFLLPRSLPWLIWHTPTSPTLTTSKASVSTYSVSTMLLFCFVFVFSLLCSSVRYHGIEGKSTVLRFTQTWNQVLLCHLLAI